MHQHPRSAPRTGSPSGTSNTNSPRPEDRERQPSQSGTDNTKGLGIDRASGSWDQRQGSDTPSNDAVGKLNQIVQNYFTKAALIILHNRVDLPPAYTRDTEVKRVNKWFNVELDETDLLRDDLLTWRGCHFIDHRPPPLIIETYLDASQLTNSQSLVIIDDDGKRCDVLEALSTLPSRPHTLSDYSNRIVVLERWKIEIGDPAATLPADLAAQLPSIYKRSIVLFRSLWTYAKFLPAWKFSKQRAKNRLSPVLIPRFRISPGMKGDTSNPDNLTAPLYRGNNKPLETYSFGTTDSPAGPFSVTVTYRTNCEFRVDDSEALLSSRFMGADDDFFRPSLPAEDTVRAGDQEVGSLPVERRGAGEPQPDPSQAYGSLSTFHQVGPITGTSPISALRAARDLGEGSPGSPPSQPPQSSKYGQAARVARLSGETGSHPVQRRPSVSFQPFKAPVLSASPSAADNPPSSSHGRNISAPPKAVGDDRGMPPPSAPAAAARRPTAQIASENATGSSASASPKQAPISKYSSSFSHRRGRLSSGGTSKGDEDNNSSGRASASSSTAQPSSGILAEAEGGSSGSWHADDDNISDFLKMLDTKKDLLSPSTSSGVDANTRRTAAALSRFHKMKDANAALSESMSSSMVLQKSSTSSSRQLPNVPPMVAATSTSTSSSPGKAISPHTPHTPAIPSRLSSNSIVEYPNQQHDARSTQRRPPHQPSDSPLEEASSDETTMDPATSNAAAIDIPTSPPFIPDFRRASSAAQRRRTDDAPDDEVGEFCFGMRSMSLGAEERPPLSLSALLQQQEQDHSLSSTRPSRQQDDNQQQQQQQQQQRTATGSNPPHSTSESSQARHQSSSSSTSQPYQPRFASHMHGGRGSNAARPPSRGSVSSSLGRGNALPSYLQTRDREATPTPGTGTDSGGSSSTTTTTGTPATAAAAGVGAGTGAGGSGAPSRRGSHRFSFTRHSHNNSSGNNSHNAFEDDEPLLFTMSDFGTSRRSLEESRRDAPASGGASGGPPAPAASSRQRDAGQGGSATTPGTGGYRTWQ